VTACWVGGSQTSSVKALAGRVTSIDTELFEICLATAKVSITGCLNISVIADSFPAARRAVDTDIHSGKGHSIAIAKLIRAHFETHPEGSLRFWECPSKAERFINAEVHKEVTRTRYPTEERMQTSYDMLRQTNSKKCLEEWVTNFTKGDIRGRGFLTTRMNKRDESRPTYARGETWLSLFGSITLCARAVRTTLVHAPIGKCRARFHP